MPTRFDNKIRDNYLYCNHGATAESHRRPLVAPIGIGVFVRDSFEIARWIPQPVRKSPLPTYSSGQLAPYRFTTREKEYTYRKTKSTKIPQNPLSTLNPISRPLLPSPYDRIHARNVLAATSPRRFNGVYLRLLTVL